MSFLANPEDDRGAFTFPTANKGLYLAAIDNRLLKFSRLLRGDDVVDEPTSFPPAPFVVGTVPGLGVGNALAVRLTTGHLSLDQRP
ncbi:hypothetical protein HKBW3S06_00749 [Candidatus Hakubella thermalkaliphila]|uniref:Uncharacterized protein n=1 Tax=Candidatus Hakubella thermalkaliphila TaxID=2754717 RepID=A0A6V8NMG4_9ACTN|nr:hypothetical protein HKBW3S06_00749 [Candidatus Hakubella thermalkaliphila]GFP42721.1 hypothetical protein HKBW3C_01845 [Candidatus Hakubella thermalkaliphila]